MNKEKILKIVLGILMVIAVLVWAKGCGRPLPSKNSLNTPPSFLNPTEMSSLLAMSQGMKGSLHSSYPAWGRNPFVLEAASNTRKIILNGILWDDQNPQALIGDHIVKEGDTIGSSIVVDIHPDSVILNNGIEYLELKLGEGE